MENTKIDSAKTIRLSALLYLALLCLSFLGEYFGWMFLSYPLVGFSVFVIASAILLYSFLAYMFTEGKAIPHKTENRKSTNIQSFLLQIIMAFCVYRVYTLGYIIIASMSMFVLITGFLTNTFRTLSGSGEK